MPWSVQDEENFQWYQQNCQRHQQKADGPDPASAVEVAKRNVFLPALDWQLVIVAEQ
jgi:hypothetical protein